MLKSNFFPYHFSSSSPNSNQNQNEDISDSDSDPDSVDDLVSQKTNIKKNNLLFVLASILICFLNVWTLFSAILWFTIVGMPQGILLFFELVIEILLFFEIITRIIIKSIWNDHETLSLFHSRKNDPWWRYCALFIISIPQYSIIVLLDDFHSYNIEDATITIGLPIRLLRIFEIIRFTEKAEELLFFIYVKGFIYFKIFVNFFWILLLTHSSAATWLLIQKFATKEVYSKESINEHNPLRDGLSYFARTNKEDASIYEKYIDSLQWVITCICGVSFGDVTPRLIPEILASLSVMILGASLLAKLFGDFVSLNHLLIKEKNLEREKYVQTIKFCQLKNIPREIKEKVHTYYHIDDGIISLSILQLMLTLYQVFIAKYQDVWKFMPICLHTEIMLLINKDFISSCKLFQACTFDFLIILIKKLKPCICLPGDIIIKIGEIVEMIYFIRDGKVEIVDSIGDQRANILKKGEIFGQIDNNISTNKSNVMIKALKKCSFLMLSKDDYLKLMDLYPIEMIYFQKAINQSNKKFQKTQVNSVSIVKLPDTTIPITNNSEKNNLGEINVKKAEKSKTYSTKDSYQNPKQNLNKSIIYPFSKIYYGWTYLLGLAVCYNLFYVPYSLTFGFEASDSAFMLFDVISVAIYLIDIFIQFKIAIPSLNGYTTDNHMIFWNYLNTYLISDLLSAIPIDYIFIGIGSPHEYKQWIRILRLIKIKKCKKILEEIMDNMGSKCSLLRVQILVILFIYMNHYAACGMFAICHLMEKEGIQVQGLNFFRRYDEIAIMNKPLIDEPHWVQYINCLYWAYQASSTSATCDIVAVTPTEKFFQIFVMLAFRVYIAFLTAEVSSLVASYRVAYTENMEKMEVYNNWMNHAKISLDIKLRVNNFNEYKWQKFRGLNENKILEDLPPTIRFEILEYMLKDIIEGCDLFPKNEPGFISTLLKKFTFSFLTEDEYLLKKGQIAEEVYFIIEGKAAVLDDDEQSVLFVLRKNDILGEMAIAQEGAGLRTKSVKAITALSLAVLSIREFVELCKLFPAVDANVKQKIDHRTKFNMAAKARNDKKRFTSGENLPLIIKEQNSNMEFDDIFKSINDEDIDLNEKDLHEQDEIPMKTVKYKSLSRENISKQQNIQRAHSIDLPLYDKSILHGGEIYDSPKRKLSSCNIQLANISNFNAGNPIKSQKSDENYLLMIESPRGELNLLETDRSNKILTICSDKRGFKDEIILTTQNEVIKQPEYKISSQESIKKPGTLKRQISFKKSNFMPSVNFKNVIITIIAGYNYIFIPLKCSFRGLSYTIPLIIIEILSIIVLTYYTLMNLKKYIQNKKIRNYGQYNTEEETLFRKTLMNESKLNVNTEINDLNFSETKESFDILNNDNLSLWIIIKDLIAIVPFSLIFDFVIEPSFRIHSILYTLLQFNRLLIGEKLYLIFIFKIFKKNIAITSLVTILYTFVIMNHVAACIWIMIGNLSDDDMNMTWFSKLPSPYHEWPTPRPSKNIEDYVSESEVYISALFWSYFNSSHGGGDINAINIPEKIYTSVYILISLLFYVFLFGDVVSLIDEIKPKFQTIFEKNYYAVLQYLKSNSLGMFTDIAKKYYDYLWASSKGINEEQILNELPNMLKFDIILEHYNEPIHFCNFFKDEYSMINYNIVNYFFKKCKYSIYMQDETIISAGLYSLPIHFQTYYLGSLVDSIFIILEGEAVKQNKFSTKKKANSSKLEVGAVFGGIIPKWNQIHNIIALKLSKLAVLDGMDYAIICKAYPIWAETQRNDITAYRALTSFARKWKKARELIKMQRMKNNVNASNVDDIKSSQNKPLALDKKVKTALEKGGFAALLNPMNLEKLKQSSNGYAAYTALSALNDLKQKHQQDFKTRYCYINPNSRAKIVMDLIHLGLILYSGIALPVIVGFKMLLNPFTLTMEILCLIESIYYIISQFFTARNAYGTLTLDRKILFEYFLKHGLILEIIGLIPFNLIFGLTNDHYIEYFTDITRILRVILLFRTIDIFEVIMANYPRTINWLQILKPWLLFVIVSHMTACLWIWINMIEQKYELHVYWYSYLEMDSRTTGEVYIFALFFVMNIATTIGFPEMILTNSFERLVFILYVYIGDALFALAFGLIVTSSHALPEKYDNVYDIISFLDELTVCYSLAQSFLGVAYSSHINRLEKKWKGMRTRQKPRIDALFALAFGLIVTSSHALPEKYDNVYDIISKTHIIAEENGISSKVHNKLQEFYEFLVFSGGDTNFLHDLHQLLPENMVRNATIKKLSEIYMCPLFDEARSYKFLEDLVTNLEQRIYLINDYLTQKGDKDQNLFFIHEGQANILSKNQSCVIKALSKGSYVGILSLLFKTKRKNSIVSLGNCIVFILSQRNFKNLLDKYPADEGQIRTNAYKMAINFGLNKTMAESILRSGNGEPLSGIHIDLIPTNLEKFNSINIDEILSDSKHTGEILKFKKSVSDFDTDIKNKSIWRLRNNSKISKRRRFSVNSQIEDKTTLEKSINLLRDNNLDKIYDINHDEGEEEEMDLEKMKKSTNLINSKQKRLSRYSELKIKWGINLNQEFWSLSEKIEGQKKAASSRIQKY